MARGYEYAGKHHETLASIKPEGEDQPEMTSAERIATEDMRSPAMSGLVKAVAGEVASLLRQEFARLAPSDVQPVLLNVKQAAVYLGRTEQSVQHLIFQRDLPVVRMGRRVHLHRRDLDSWIEKNKY